jgi:hypothetical protein
MLAVPLAFLTFLTFLTLFHRYKPKISFHPKQRSLQPISTFRFRVSVSMPKNSKSIAFVPGKGDSSHHHATRTPRTITELAHAASHAYVERVRQVLSHE